MTKEKLTRRGFLAKTATTLGAASIMGCASPQTKMVSGTSKKPNVLLVFADQLRADALSAYGNQDITTPHLDRMAREGVMFANAVSSCSLCTPYRAMLMTGRHPTHSGVVLNHVEINPNQRCLGHVFGDAGYKTGFIGKWHLAAGVLKNVGLVQRPDAEKYYVKRHSDFIPPGEQRLGFEHWQAYNFHLSFAKPWYYQDQKKVLYMDGYETDAETDMAMKFMSDCHAQDKPFFAVVAPHPPHPPFNPKLCPEGYLQKVPTKLHTPPNVPKDHPRRLRLLERRCYYAMTQNVDDNMGRLLDFLDRTGLSQNTIMIFTSDHGEMHGSHGKTNKLVPYAESVNVPLIMRWPGHIPAGLKTDALQTPIDHMTTLCGLTNLEAPATADGIDLSSVVLGRKTDKRDAVMMANYCSHYDYFQSGTIYPEWRAVKTRRYTYVKWLTGKEHLFDNKSDPYQMNNLVNDKSQQKQLEQLRRRLTQLLAKAHDEFLPGTAYSGWYDEQRNLISNALGPVS